MNILYVHQSSELYGSDKVLLNIVWEMKRRKKYNPIVIIPDYGELYRALRDIDVNVYVGAIAKVSRNTFSLTGFLKLFRDLILSILFINKISKKHKISLIHSNTLAVLGGAAYAFIFRVPHLWHVHELILAPVFLKKAYPLFLQIFSDSIVCISESVRDWIVSEQPNALNKCTIVWNGIPELDYEDAVNIDQIRRDMGIKNFHTAVALVGRINRWKGHGVLIDALTELHRRKVTGIVALIVGSAPDGQEHFILSLKDKISQSPAAHHIEVMPYRNDIRRIWLACDVAVVPSTEPEPFGLVAIEAMSAGRPVIGAAHGGLLEIIVNEQTGLLVEPGNSIALADAIQRMSKDKVWARALGNAGRIRQRTYFSLFSQGTALEKIYNRFF